MSRPRAVHPGAWWLWALGLAAAATRTTNPLLLVSLIAVAAVVVAARRTDAPWARSFRAFLMLAVLVVVIRLVFEALFGAPVPGTTLLTLPEITLPEWMAGVRLGGAVTAEAMLGALYAGLQLAAIIACIGAANSLANPSRLLKSLPGSLYELGVAVVVALTVAPQAVAHLAEVRRARRLRGRTDGGLRGLAGSALPVLEGALERSLLLAAAMDSRGYGRSGATAPRRRRLATAALVTGLGGALLGSYALLDAGTPGWAGLPLLGLGLLVALGSVTYASRGVGRTVYRPDPWLAPEWITAGSGAVAAVVLATAQVLGVPALDPPTDPLSWPPLPVVPLLAILLALLPAVATPVPPNAAGHSRPTRPLAAPSPRAATREQVAA